VLAFFWWGAGDSMPHWGIASPGLQPGQRHAGLEAHPPLRKRHGDASPCRRRARFGRCARNGRGLRSRGRSALSKAEGPGQPVGVAHQNLDDPDAATPRHPATPTA
jgi:hypothetical protein